MSAKVRFEAARSRLLRDDAAGIDSNPTLSLPLMALELVSGLLGNRPALVKESSGWSGCISPNGERLLISRNVEDTDPKSVLFGCDVATDDCVKLVDGGKDESWSPDGSRIAVCVGDGAETDITVISADGTNTEIIGEGYMPCWSKDGSKLFFMDFSSTWKMMQCKLSAEPNVTEPVFSDLVDSFAQVSPDETRIVLVDEKQNLVVADLTTRKTIVSNSVAGMGGLMKTWHPDSTHVAFGGFKDHGIWVMNASTGKAIQLLEGTYVNPRWSANGKFMSVDNRSKGQVEVFDVSGVELP